MKNLSMDIRSAIALLLLVVMLSTPLLVLAQEKIDSAAIIAAAERDAEDDVNKSLWTAMGFCIGCFGFLAASAVEPNPPATKLIGKSPEYVAIYTDAYKRKAKRIQQTHACTGWVVGAAVAVMVNLSMSEY